MIRILVEKKLALDLTYLVDLSASVYVADGHAISDDVRDQVIRFITERYRAYYTAAGFSNDEISAVQNAMNLRLQDEFAFFAEYQNEPLPPENSSPTDLNLSADDIAGTANGRKRGEVPTGSNHVVMFVDVQQKLLYSAE